MTDEAWNAGFVKALGVVLIGHNDDTNERGEPIVGDNLMLLLNAHWEPIEFNFPRVESIVDDFERLFDTAEPALPPTQVDVNKPYVLMSRTTALFRWTLAHHRRREEPT
jgi:glycogen operon protein